MIKKKIGVLSLVFKLLRGIVFFLVITYTSPHELNVVDAPELLATTLGSSDDEEEEWPLNTSKFSRCSNRKSNYRWLRIIGGLELIASISLDDEEEEERPLNASKF